MGLAVRHGKPVVRGARVLVASVVGAEAAGQSCTGILKDYFSLTDADITARFAFAGQLARWKLSAACNLSQRGCQDTIIK